MIRAGSVARQDRQRRRLSRTHVTATALGVCIVLVCTALRIHDPYELRLARELVFDEFQRLAPRPDRDALVRVVDIDEKSLAAIGQWPWPRDVLATLVDRLGGLGAKAIVFDMVFPEPDRLSPSRIAHQADLSNAIGTEWADALAARLPDHDQRLHDAIA